MHNIIIRGILALSLAAVGCSELTIVGVSGELGEAPAPASSTPAALRTTTAFRAKSGELLQSYGPPLGDINGDGYEDFILAGSDASRYVETDRPDYSQAAQTAYLFYGRPSFPENVSALEADATFDAGNPYSYAVGDVNGDGLGDFVLYFKDGYELIFGRAERFSGHHAKFSTGPVVTYPYESELDGSIEYSGLDKVESVGDLNGDGKNDLIVRLVERDAEAGNVFGVGLTDYILEGRADGWPTGAWDASWAVAKPGLYNVSNSTTSGRLSVVAGGDIDGDGYADLIAMGWESSVIFYGTPQGLHGTLEDDQADARLLGQIFPAITGDLDGDGALELMQFNDDYFAISYGKRFKGDTQLTADLTFSKQWPYGGAHVGDTNGDGMADLLFVANSEVGLLNDGNPTAFTFRPELYIVRGDGTRLTGEQLGTERFEPVGYNLPDGLPSSNSFYVAAGGDFDGDGSTDLLLGAPGQEAPANSMVYLLPGSMNDPD